MTVCMYVCLSVCVYVCVSVCMYVCLSVCLSVRVCVREMFVSVRTCEPVDLSAISWQGLNGKRSKVISGFSRESLFPQPSFLVVILIVQLNLLILLLTRSIIFIKKKLF